MHVYICKFMLRFNIERYTDYQFMADVDIFNFAPVYQVDYISFYPN